MARKLSRQYYVTFFCATYATNEAEAVRIAREQVADQSATYETEQPEYAEVYDAEGTRVCPHHPHYKALRKPRSVCWHCHQMWREAP